MTVIHTQQGYLERDYLEEAYLSQGVYGNMGFEALFSIADFPNALGMQVDIQIVDYPRAFGQQAQFVIESGNYPVGAQANFDITGGEPVGMQANLSTSNFPYSLGMQAEISIVDFPSSYGMEYWDHNFAHLTLNKYLTQNYLEDPYLTSDINACGGFQAEFNITYPQAYGMQAEFNIVDFQKSFGEQAEFNIVDFPRPMGMQTEFIRLFTLGMQATISLYNTTNLRILCDFPSRGLSSATGTNQWGNPAGQGQNWKATFTEAGDFSPFNLNTDIVEQVWRSPDGYTTGINLDCDTERPQGVFLDTFAMLNHNLTTSATVNLIGSNDPTFGVPGVVIPLLPRLNDPNTYYIAPTLPNVGYKYWRIAIDDPSNPDNFLQVGTIIFGAASIFVGECFVDEVEFQLKDFADTVETEGFTNVSNSRAQKKVVRLDFRSLNFTKGNFKTMRNIFAHARTVLKCLWIPTPDAVNEDYTARFALFSKLVQVPVERHNNKGRTADYVSFTVELDESK